MNYGRIIERDSTNGTGIRVTLFVSGCTHCCKGCFQPETWDFKYGKEFTKEVEDHIIDLLKPDYVSGLTILGGDPFEISNQRALYPFIKRIKEELKDKNIWAFTGDIYEELINDKGKYHCDITNDMISLIDVLVDGPFIESLSSLMLKYKGSSNQRLIDIQKTIKQNEIVLYE